MFKQILFPILLVALLPLILRLMIKLRLGIAIAYVVLANTLLLDWAATHIALSDGILFCILGLTALRWLAILYRKARDHLGFSRAARMREHLLTAQLRAARAGGIATEDICIKTAKGIPCTKY